MKKNYFSQILLFSLFCLVLLAACSSVTTSTPTLTPTPTLLAPAADKTTVMGRVVNTSGEPYKDLIVRLAEVYYATDDPNKGAYVLDTAFSPGGITDQDGYFIIPDIKPMDYVLVLGSPDAAYKIVENEEGKAKVWHTEAGKILDMGEISLDFDFNP